MRASISTKSSPLITIPRSLSLCDENAFIISFCLLSSRERYTAKLVILPWKFDHFEIFQKFPQPSKSAFWKIPVTQSTSKSCCFTSMLKILTQLILIFEMVFSIIKIRYTLGKSWNMRSQKRKLAVANNAKRDFKTTPSIKSCKVYSSTILDCSFHT